MDGIHKAVCAWAGAIWMSLLLGLALQVFAQPVGKTFVIWTGGGEFETWEIIAPDTMVKIETFMAPHMGGGSGFSPAGDYLLDIKKLKLYLADSRGLHEQLIPHTEDMVLWAWWDWTGGKFLFLTYANNSLWIGEITPDKSVRVHRVATWVGTASFSPDGKTLILGRKPRSGQPGLYLLNLADGSESLLSTRDSKVCEDIVCYVPEWTADGRYVLFLARSPSSQGPHYQHPFWVLDLSNGSEHHLKLTGKGPLPPIHSPPFWSERGDRLIYWGMGLNGKPDQLVSLAIDLTSMTITNVEMLGEARAIGWIEPGKLVLVGGPAVLDLTGSDIKVIRERPLKIREDGKGEPEHCRPILGGHVARRWTGMGFMSNNCVASASTHLTLDKFLYDGLDFKLGKNRAEIRRNLGDPKESTMEKVQNPHDLKEIDEIHNWYYDGLHLSIYSQTEDNESVRELIITSSKYKIKYGLNIGSSIKYVKKILGNPYSYDAEKYAYASGMAGVYFYFRDGIVQTIAWVFGRD